VNCALFSNIDAKSFICFGFLGQWQKSPASGCEGPRHSSQPQHAESIRPMRAESVGTPCRLKLCSRRHNPSTRNTTDRVFKWSGVYLIDSHMGCSPTTPSSKPRGRSSPFCCHTNLTIPCIRRLRPWTFRTRVMKKDSRSLMLIPRTLRHCLLRAHCGSPQQQTI
jgi:hypothetical protein